MDSEAAGTDVDVSQVGKKVALGRVGRYGDSRVETVIQATESAQ